MNEGRIVKGTLGGFEEEIQNPKQNKKLNADNIKEVQIQTQKKIFILFSEENKVIGTLFDAGKVAGSATL